MTITEFAEVRKRNQFTLPPAIARALRVKVGDKVEFTATEDGAVTVRGARIVPTDQAWFWSPEWQAMEREVDVDRAAGVPPHRFGSVAEMDVFLDSLDDS
ncbi:MAG: AbrB/MazE/SpoVT family DNA-binding domain-containing protein [Promicromonosporaceae bacterium]|nr:AbrB/MazE/SpoVT family DNA-binding domain-containing protein [Promicromonosporaceae bacterium]